MHREGQRGLHLAALARDEMMPNPYAAPRGPPTTKLGSD